jgi:alpha-1,3-glucan synthase
MPGWWFTIESTTSRHLLQQFKTAIREALACKTEVRAMMRARSLIQRFPVAQWIEDLEKLQSTSIRINLHQQQSSQAHSLFRQLGSGWTTPTLTTPTTTAPNTTPNTAPPSREGSRAPSPTNGGTETWSNRQSLMSQIFGPGHSPTRGRNRLTKSNPHSRSSSHTSFQGGEESNRNSRDVAEPAIIVSSDEGVEASSHRNITGNAPRVPSRLQNQVQLLSPLASPNPSAPGTPSAEDGLLPNPFDQEPTVLKKRLSVNSIIGQQKDFNLQKVDPFFTDSENLYYGIFDKKLNNVDAKSSEDELCIEEYLVKSEKQWFSRFHRAKLGMSSRPPTPTSSVFRLPWGGDDDDASSHHEAEDSIEESLNGEFLLGDDYTPPGKLRNLLQRKIGDWQLYCFFLAFVSLISNYFA